MDNKTIMQFFEWYLPDNGLLWKRCAAQAGALKKAGVTSLWLPPAYKGAGGPHSVGYDVYDTYDLGEFDQKGSVATKYGSRKDYEAAVKALQKEGIEVLADVVLNHMMGADATEKIRVVETSGSNRQQQTSGEKEIDAWTSFTFPGRGDRYCSHHWSGPNFSGMDWDDASKKNAIYRLAGKGWDQDTDKENGNYDYLMGVDLDMGNPDTVKAVTDWGKWYLDTISPDGFRLDAVKHISFDFYRDWLKEMRAHAGRDFFVVGEYWSKELGAMTNYLDCLENSLSLFDVTLHFNFLHAATSNGNFDMGGIWNGSLTQVRPMNAVTFVDNHDTQPGQALQSFIPAWFKPIAYALILLGNQG
ncbi:MAG: alpha-amylase, partial [Eubacterium sp.]|nr:alpha-amylase [Eubacterium sp.]